MSKNDLDSEFNLEKTEESIQYPEFNDLFRKNEFNDRYYSSEINLLAAELSRSGKETVPAKAKPAKRRTPAVFRTITAALAATVIVAAAVLLSVLVNVLSATAGTDYLAFELSIRNENDVPLMALLLDESGEWVASYALDKDTRELFFEGLNDDSVYVLRVVREDNGDVLLENSYRTEKADVRIPFRLLPESEEVTFFGVSLTFRYEGELPEQLTALVDGETVGLRVRDGLIILEANELPESTFVTVRILDGDSGETLFDGEYETLPTPPAAAEQIREELSPNEAVFTVVVNNPFGHRLTVRSDAGETVFSYELEDQITVKLSGLSESTSYRYEVFDETTQTLVLESDFTTPAGGPASVTMKEVGIHAFSAEFIFIVNNPFGHTLRASADPGEASYELLDNGELFVQITGLPEVTYFVLTVTDETANSLVYESGFTTHVGAEASASLKESDVGYFSALLIFTVTDPVGHGVNVTVNGADESLDMEDDGTATLYIERLTEKTEYVILLTDGFTGNEILRLTVTTPATPSATVSVTSVDTDYFGFRITYLVENPYGHKLSFLIDDDPGTRRELDLTDPCVSCSYPEEHTTHKVTVTDENTGEILREDNITTRNAGDASVLLLDEQIRWFDADFTLYTENPAFHRLDAFLNGNAVPFQAEDSRLTLSLTGLSEQTAYLLTFVDGTTGATVFTRRFTTQATPSASVVLTESGIDYDEVVLSFLIRNPHGHLLVISFDGRDPVPLEEDMLFEGLLEGSAYRYIVSDTHTGEVLLTGSVRTRSAGDAAASLTKSTVGYFEAILNFSIVNPARHPIKAYVDGFEKALRVSGSGGVLTLDGLQENTTYAVTLVDGYTGSDIYTGAVTTAPTPPAEVSLIGEPSVGYFDISLIFKITNPYGHVLRLIFDGGAEQSLLASHTFNGLAEGSTHTVTVKDVNTGTTIFSRAVTTASAGSAAVTLKSSTVNYFDAKLTFTISNPAKHTLKAFVGSVEKPFSVSGSTGTLKLTGLAEKTKYTITIKDVTANATVYTGTITTKATPAAEVSLSGTPVIGYFDISLNFTVSNPYNHDLKLIFDGGAEQNFSTSVTFTGLSEGSSHTVEVKDKKTNTIVFSQTFTTASAGSATVTLKSSTVNYFDAKLTFTISNPANHTLKAYLGSTEKPFSVSGTTGTLNLTGLAEKTKYTITIKDVTANATVYTGTITTKATPAAEVSLSGAPTIGYFDISLNFTVSNPYNHDLKLIFDGGAEQNFSTSVTFTGLSEGSSHTVEVKDKKTNTTVFSQTFTTKSAGEATVTLKSSTVNYFDAKLTFTISNPANHTLKAYLGSTEKSFTVSGTTGTLNLTGLAEAATYSVRIVDTRTGTTAYSGSFTTKETPAATVTLTDSSVGSISIRLNFAVSGNNYGHTLQYSINGRRAAFTPSYTISGCTPLTSFTVEVIDVNPVTGISRTVYSGSFTTTAPAIISQTPEGKVSYRLADDLARAYSGRTVFIDMTAKEPFNPDTANIFFMVNEDLVSGTSSSTFIFKGVYEVSLYIDQEVVFTFEHTLEYGLTPLEVDTARTRTSIFFYVSSGEMPTLYGNDVLRIYIYDVFGTVHEFVSGVDFTVTSDGFTINVHSTHVSVGNFTEFQIELVRTNENYGFESAIILCIGTIG